MTRLSVAADEDGLAGQHGVCAPLERVDHGLPLAAAVVQKQWEQVRIDRLISKLRSQETQLP